MFDSYQYTAKGESIDRIIVLKATMMMILIKRINEIMTMFHSLISNKINPILGQIVCMFFTHNM